MYIIKLMEHIKCPIFNFSEKYSFTFEESSLYNDVIIHTGSNRQIEWENCIAVKFVDNIPRVIVGSNHFLTWKTVPEDYNNKFKIFDNLVYNYIDIVNNNKPVRYDLDDNLIYVWLLDAFSFSNSGHNLSECLDKANFIIKNGYKNVLIPTGFREQNNFKFLEILLPDVIFTELDFDSIFFIKNVVIIPDCHFDILKHPTLIETLKNRIAEKYGLIYSDCKYKKVVLMKTHRNKKVFDVGTQLICEDLLCELEKDGYVNIIPEDTDPFKLVIYLLFAKTIVNSSGSIMYTNKQFFNLKANLIWIGNINSKYNTTDHIIEPLLKWIFTESLILNKDEILPQIKEFDKELNETQILTETKEADKELNEPQILTETKEADKELNEPQILTETKEADKELNETRILTETKEGDKELNETQILTETKEADKELNETQILTETKEGDKELNETQILTETKEADKELNKTHILTETKEADKELNETQILTETKEGDKELNETQILTETKEADKELNETQILPQIKEADKELNKTQILPQIKEADK